MNITRERFIEIMKDENIKRNFDKHILDGFNIIRKYDPIDVIAGAAHDIIYSANIDQLINNGINEQEVIELAEIGFHIQDDEYLAKFV